MPCIVSASLLALKKEIMMLKNKALTILLHLYEKHCPNLQNCQGGNWERKSMCYPINKCPNIFWPEIFLKIECGSAGRKPQVHSEEDPVTASPEPGGQRSASKSCRKPCPPSFQSLPDAPEGGVEREVEKSKDLDATLPNQGIDGHVAVGMWR